MAACWLAHASLEVRPRLLLPLAFSGGPETRAVTGRLSEVVTEASEAGKQAGRPYRQWELHGQRACGGQEQVTRASMVTALLVEGWRSGDGGWVTWAPTGYFVPDKLWPGKPGASVNPSAAQRARLPGCGHQRRHGQYHGSAGAPQLPPCPSCCSSQAWVWATGERYSWLDLGHLAAVPSPPDARCSCLAPALPCVVLTTCAEGGSDQVRLAGLGQSAAGRTLCPSRGPTVWVLRPLAVSANLLGWPGLGPYARAGALTPPAPHLESLD